MRTRRIEETYLRRRRTSPAAARKPVEISMIDAGSGVAAMPPPPQPTVTPPPLPNPRSSEPVPGAVPPGGVPDARSPTVVAGGAGGGTAGATTGGTSGATTGGTTGGTGGTAGGADPGAPPPCDGGRGGELGLAGLDTFAACGSDAFCFGTCARPPPAPRPPPPPPIPPPPPERPLVAVRCDFELDPHSTPCPFLFS